jgi:hypothetical protein
MQRKSKASYNIRPYQSNNNVNQNLEKLYTFKGKLREVLVVVVQKAVFRRDVIRDEVRIRNELRMRGSFLKEQMTE